jgi:hypothetical protein
MRTTTYSDLVNKSAPWRRAKNGLFGLLDGLYRTFAPRNKYGLTARQTATTLKIAKNGAAGVVLAQLYACSGCGIASTDFGTLIADNHEVISGFGTSKKKEMQ